MQRRSISTFVVKKKQNNICLCYTECLATLEDLHFTPGTWSWSVPPTRWVIVLKWRSFEACELVYMDISARHVIFCIVNWGSLPP